jgi:methionine-rich copper-binding protein CopC
MIIRIARWGWVAAAVAVLSLPAGAFAHAGIKSRSPKAGDSVSSPSSVTVTFKERVIDANLSVASAGGAAVPTSARALLRGKTRVRVRLSRTLSPGSYRATVRYLADDGHAQSTSWTFRVR